jgi:hypothetical protein
MGVQAPDEQRQETMDEKRAHRRKLMREPAAIATLANEQWQPVVLLDISTHGLSFTHGLAMESGAVHALRFSLPGSSGRHTAHIVIVHNATWGVPSGFRIGARFQEIDAATQAAIAAFVAS